MTNTCVMLVGLPMSGKSYFYEQSCGLSLFEGCDKIRRISSDSIIEEVADILGTSYNDVFNFCIKYTEKVINRDLELAIKFGWSIIWDQTNLTSKSRLKKLAKIPKDWKKIAVYFILDGTKLEERKAQRAKEGKSIPEEIFEKMLTSTQEPSYDEGFDEIYVYFNDELRIITR